MDINLTYLKKKAVLFSLISLLFSALFITIFSQNILKDNTDNIISSNVRIKVIDTYVRNFQLYTGDSLKVSSYKTLDAITLYRDNNGKFFSSYEEFRDMFVNCMICNDVNCVTPTASCGLNDEYFTAKIDNITQLSLEQLNINTTYIINSINITQNYPFEIEVDLNITYNISDNSGNNNYAKWDKTDFVNQSITIIGLIDPQGYMNDSSNTYNRRIIKSEVCDIGEACWNYTTTEEFYNQSSFRYHTNGTSFIQRYWSDHNSSSCCGIETILHPNEIAGINKNNSYIDHYYWNGLHLCTAQNNVLNLSLGNDDVHFDEIAASRYGVTSSSTIYCRP